MKTIQVITTAGREFAKKAMLDNAITASGAAMVIGVCTMLEGVEPHEDVSEEHAIQLADGALRATLDAAAKLTVLERGKSA